jgi:hypothetical protein
MMSARQCPPATDLEVMQGGQAVGPGRTFTCDNELFVHSPTHGRSHFRLNAGGADGDRPPSRELQGGGYAEMRVAHPRDARLRGS